MKTLSVTDRLESHLRLGRKITQLQALKMWGCMRLGARVHELRSAGMNIATKTITQNGKHFAQYYLPQ